MIRITTSKAREEMADLMSRVHYSGERVVLTRHSKPFVALVPAKDLDLIEMIEDRIDIDEARKVLANSDERVPFEEVCRRLGL